MDGTTVHRTIVATDGGHRYDMAGSAWVMDRTRFGARSLPCRSAYHAELTALLDGMEQNPGALTLRSDFEFPATAPLILEKIERYQRRHPDDESWGFLVERFRALTEDCALDVVRVPSKGATAVAEVAVCDLIERYCRRMAVITQDEFRLDPGTLSVGDTGDLFADFHAALDAREVGVHEAGVLVRRLDPR